jgi:hypothetical protein
MWLRMLYLVTAGRCFALFALLASYPATSSEALLNQRSPLLLLLLQTREGHKPHDQLLLVMREDCVGYCQFDGQVKLRKRKRQPGDEPRPEKVRGCKVPC